MYYFAGVISSVPRSVVRPPIASVHLLPDADPRFGQIRQNELAADNTSAIASLEALFGEPDWQSIHATWPLTASQTYWQMLRDYELVRIPMLFGRPSDPVTSTRNPARGILPFRKEFVVTMVTVGDAILGGPRKMRWGASNFGAPVNGDIQHFDLGANYE